MSYLVHHLTVLTSFLLTYLLLENDTPNGLILATITAVNMPFLLILERLMPYQKSSSPFSDNATPSDLGHFGVSIVARTLIVGGGTLTVAGFSQGGLIGVWPNHWPMIVQVVIAMFVWEIVTYWRHRLQHNVNYFWPMHAVHHDTKVFHTFKATRAHFMDDWFSYGFEMMVPALLGAPPEVYIWILTWTVSFGNVTHANIRQDNPKWIHYLVPTVQLHRWHHTQEGMHTNMSGTFPIIDLLFGTFRHPSTYTKGTLGCGDQEMPSNFLGQLWYPVRKLLLPSA